MKLFTIIMNFKETTPDKSTLDKVMPEHLDYFKKALNAGKILISGPNALGNGGVIIMKATNLEEAKNFMSTEPLTVNGFTSYTMVEFEAMDYLPSLKDWLEK